SQVIANVAVDLEGAIERLFPAQIGHGVGEDEPLSTTPRPRFDRAHTVAATGGGYVQAVDSSRLLTLAREHGLLVRIDARPGSFVRAGTPLVAVVATATPADELAASLRAVFIIGADRSGTQDLGFFIDQLVELAVRALSPGINDPATARACIDRLEQALCRLAGRRMPSPYRHDDDGVLRVVASPVTFVEMLDRALTEITRYGRSSVSVSCRVLAAIRDLAPCVSANDDRLALARQAVFAGEHPADSFDHEMDRVSVAEGYREALAALQDQAGAASPPD
ncbi:MAG: DUF2254 family protein, partial [Vicinamibacterales bacterium]